MWNELAFLWNDPTIEWNDLTWNDLAMERTDWIPHLYVYVSIGSRSRGDRFTNYDQS